MVPIKILVVLCLYLVVMKSDMCPGNKPNNNPVHTNDPVLLRTTKNGKLYQAGVDNNDTLYPMFVLHTWGTPYEQGLAHGTLLKNEVSAVLYGMYQRISSQIDVYLKFLPQKLRQLIEKYGLAMVLDLTYEMTRWYTPKYWEEEMQGLSDGSGVSLNDILRIHMLPELIKAGCSMFIAYGPATPRGNLLQLRALDWDSEANLQKYSLVHIRHPSEDGSWGHAFSTFGWAGFIAALTGMSSNGMAISEKYGDQVFGGDSRIGYPFNYLLRDILQFDNSWIQQLPG